MNWLSSLAEKLSHILSSLASLGLSDKSAHFEILRQTLIGNSLFFATWACWGIEMNQVSEATIVSRIISSRFIRRGLAFEDDLDLQEESCAMPPEGATETGRSSKPRITLRSQCLSDGWKLLAGISVHIPADASGVSGIVGIDLALAELAEEALLHPNRQTLELIASIERDLGGALLVISASHKLLGATPQAMEAASALCGCECVRGEELNEPLLGVAVVAAGQASQAPLRQEVSGAEHRFAAWTAPLSTKGRRLLFVKPVAKPVLKAPNTEPLSKREREVLQCLSEGRSNAEIATALAISPNTVKNHLDRVFKKLGVSNRCAAALAGFKWS